MSKPIPILDLTQTQEFGAAPLEKKLGALDAAFKYNANLFDETTFDKTPLSSNDPWAKGRTLLANAYTGIRNTVSVADLHTRLQLHANKTGAEVDPTVVSRILNGGELDEEEDAGGALRGIVESWTKELAAIPAPPVRKGGGVPPQMSYPLTNPANDQDVLGHVSIYGDGHTKPYAEVTLPDPDNPDKHIFSRILLEDDREKKLKLTQDELAKMGAANYHALSSPPVETEDPYASAMGQRDLIEDTAKAVVNLQERHKTLSGPQGYAANLQEQVNARLREAPFIDKIGASGFVNGAASAIGSTLTAGMGIAPGLMSLLGVGDETGPIQHVTDKEMVNKLMADNEAGKLEGQILTPYRDENGNEGVTLRNETLIEKMQKDQADIRNMFPRHSQAEFRGTTMDRVIVGATDDALPFLADLYSGMALAKGAMTPVRMAMTAKAAALTEDAANLSKVAGLGNATADLSAITASAKAAEASLVAMKNIGRYTTIPEALIAGLPMTVKGAAHGWSDAMHTADEFDSQGRPDDAERARGNAFNSAWANFATGEGLSLLPMMRIMRNKNGENLLKITDDAMSQRPGWKKFLEQQVFHRAKKSAEFGAWTGSTAMSSNAWAKGLYDDHRELFEGVPESTAIGMIHGFGLARFSGLVDPREVQATAAKARSEAQGVQQATEMASETLNRRKAGSLFDNLARVLPSDAVVDQRSADGKWIINDPAAPAMHGAEYNSKEEAVRAAGERHREQFFADIAEYQQRIGMKPEDVNAQNVALGTAMDNVARLAGIDPQRYYASITVRDRPEGAEGPHPVSPENMRSRLDNLYDLIGFAEKNKVPQLILDKMLARHEQLRQDLAPPVNEVPPAEGQPVAPDSQAPAVTPPAQPVTEPPVARTSQSESGNTPVTKQAADPNWYKDRNLPQPEFEARVTDELAHLQRLEAEVQADLQAGKLPEDQYQAAVDWITKRQSDLQAEEVARKESAEQKAAAVQAQITDINARIAKLAVLESRMSAAHMREETIKERRALEAERRTLAQKLNQEANASIYALADQGQMIIETYKNANPTSLLHEVAHTWTLMKDPVTGQSLLDAALGSKADAFNAWASQGGKVEIGSVPYHETVAKGWEKYLSEGKPPTEELRGVFAKLSRMFRSVYNNLKGSVPLPDEARAAYDRLFDPKAKPENESPDAPITPEQAAVKLEMFEDGNLVGLHQINDPEFRLGLEGIRAAPESVIPDHGAPQRLDQGPSRVDDFRTKLWSNREAVKRKMADAWKRPSFWERWENFIPAGLRSRGQMPETMFQAQASAHNLKDAITTRAEILSEGLNNAVNDAIGINPNAANITLMSAADKAARNTLLRDVNSALMGQDHPAFSALPRPRKLALQAAAIAALPVNVRPHVQAMRAHIDSLSRALIRTGAIQGPMVATLDANNGFYMHRSYEFFDNPIHGDKVRKNDKPLMDQAVNEFMRGGMTRAQAEAEVEYLLNPQNFSGTKSPNEGFAKYLVDRRPTGIFKERSDIPEHIRKLWGEYKDPMLNYAKTVAKQATALTTFQYHLQTLAEGTRDGWLKADKDKEHPAEIFKSDDQSPVTSPRKSPLSGYYTTPEIASVFQEAQKQGIGTDSFLMSALAGGNWMAKNAVFTYNTASHVRNALGSAMLYFSNGHYAANRLFGNAKDVQGAAAAHTGILPEFWQRTLASKVGLDRTAADNERIRLTKLGLIGQNVDIGVLHSLAKRFANGVLGKDDALNTVGSHLEGLATKTQKGLEDAIQAEDSFWKVMHFYSEYKVLRDAFPATGPGSKTNGELEVIAAGRTLDVMPSWDRVVPWAKKFSSNPFFGTFVSFRAETMRNTYNAMKYGIQDMQTPGMRWHGVRRLAGMTGLRTAQAAAAKGLTKLAMGTFLDDETDSQVRLFMAPWDKDSTHAYVSVGDGKVQHVNLSYIFPMSESVDMMRILSNSESLENTGVQAFIKVFEPFLNEEFSLRLAHEIAFNEDSFGRKVYNPEDKLFGMNAPAALGGSGINRAGDVLEGKVGDAVEHGLSMIIPAVLKNSERVLAAHQGVGKESIGSAWGRIMGMRVNELDIRKQLPMVTTDVANRLASADDLFEGKFDPKNPAGHLEEGFAAMQERRKLLFGHLHKLYEGSIATGVPVGETIKLMDEAVDRHSKESLSKEELVAAITGTYIPPYRMSKNKFLQLYEKDKDRALAVLKMTGQPIKK
jgi:hypothetical protein